MTSRGHEVARALAPGGTSAPAAVRSTLTRPGRPLDPATRAFFEARFGHDFSSIRVHHDRGADAASRSIGARAFSAGRHVGFAEGEYAPGSPAGRRLLAHELAHTLQPGIEVRREPSPDVAAPDAPQPAPARGTGTVEVTNNFREILRRVLEAGLHRSLTNEAFDRMAPQYLKSKEAGLGLFPAPDASLAAAFKAEVEAFGMVTTRLKSFSPPGWEAAGGNEEACFILATAGAQSTLPAGETPTGGGGIVLYEKARKRIKTDKVASEVAVSQIRAHIDSGRAVLAGVNEPGNSRVIDEVRQPVTDHFVAIYGYVTDFRGKVVALLARDNAVAGGAEVRFTVAESGAITKPSEPGRAEKYIRQEYQLSEVRFATALPYTGPLEPTNDAGQIMYWPHK